MSSQPSAFRSALIARTNAPLVFVHGAAADVERAVARMTQDGALATITGHDDSSAAKRAADRLAGGYDNALRIFPGQTITGAAIWKAQYARKVLAETLAHHAKFPPRNGDEVFHSGRQHALLRKDVAHAEQVLIDVRAALWRYRVPAVATLLAA